MGVVVMTLEELKGHALGELGTMAEASYAEYMEQARELATPKGVANPKLIIWLVYKNYQSVIRGKEHLYPVTEEEWDYFISQTEPHLASSPVVYVVDGDKFTAEI